MRSSKSPCSRFALPAFAAALIALLLAAAASANGTRPCPVVTATGAAPPAGCTVDLAIAKTADRTAAVPGDVVTWTVRVRNAGTAPVAAGAIVVTDEGVALTPADPGAGDLAPGAERVWTGATTLSAADCPRRENTATVALRTDTARVTALKERTPRPRPKPMPKPAPKPVPTPKPRPVPVDVNPANDTATAAVDVTCPAPVTPPASTPPVVTEGTPVTPVTPPSGEVTACPLPALRVGIVAPRRALRARRIRVSVTVRNDLGKAGARVVKVRYAVPRGTVLVHVPEGARLVRGGVVVRVPALAPGAKRTTRIVLRTLRTPLRRTVHRASATATCGPVRAAATPTLFGAPRPRQPIVAG